MVGEQLQRVRSERRLSLNDVAKQTKIQPWVLEALEANRLQELMSPVYVKGFLTTYAKFLSLEPEPLMAQLVWPAPESEQAPLPPPTRTMPTIQWSLPFLRRVGTAMALSALLWGLMVLKPLHRWNGRLTFSHHKATPTLASVAKISNTITPPALPTLTLMATQPLELFVNAHSTTWIQLRADGKLIAQQRLQRGANERWTAKKQFELVVSKPSQVELTLNGQPISPFAIAHRGRLLITHRGIAPLAADEP